MNRATAYKKGSTVYLSPYMPKVLALI